MTRTRPFPAALLAFALLAIAPVTAAQGSLSGVWEVTMVTPLGPNTADVTFQQQGSTITGQMMSPLGAAPFKGTLTGDVLLVVVALDVQGTAIELTFNAKVTGDTLAGTVKLGNLGEAPFTGKRKAAAAGTAPAPAATAITSAAPETTSSAPGATDGINGNWDISLDMQGQQIPLKATFIQDGSTLTGSLTSDQGIIPVHGKMIGNTLELEFVAPTPNGDLPIVMKGTLAAGGLTGKITLTGLGDAAWVGSRSK